MAFRPRRIFPIDQRPGVAIGVSIPFKAPGVFSSTYTTKDAIRNNLINFFLTNKTERYLNNSFGANLRAFIFQQINSDNINFLKQDIQTLMSKYFPNVTIIALNVLQYPDNNAINVVLNYFINETGVSDQIEITF